MHLPPTVFQPVYVAFSELNATAVTVSWNTHTVFSTYLKYSSYCFTSGVVISRYEILLPPGVASIDVAIEDDHTLDDSKEDFQHNFTLVYTITLQGNTIFGLETTASLTFGRQCSQICLHFYNIPRR